MSTVGIAVAVVAVLASPVAWAQPLEFESTDRPSACAPALQQGSPQTPGDAGQGVQGRVYTYRDGDRTVRVRLQSDLEVSGSSTRSTGEHIVAKESAGRSTGHPVFRSESSGTLMTLPGGVLLVLEAGWNTAETHAFFTRNRITLNRVSDMGITANSFFVETAPGFPSLELANALAAQDGVRIASPNWWRELTTR